MKRMIGVIAILWMCLGFGGCCNYMFHRQGEFGVYVGTRHQWRIVKAPFDERNEILGRLVTFIYPFVLLDLPCEVVADTVTLPFDLWKTSCREKANPPH